MKYQRLPRFTRSAQVAPILLTSRDRVLIRRVFDYRFLRSTHLVALVPGSRQQILRRLQLLYHHRYLDRPRTQVEYYAHGSKAMVYGLGNEGMRLLEREGGVPHRKLDWTARSRTINRCFMEHTLAVADATVALELACHKHRINLIDPGQQTPFKWSLGVSRDGVATKITVIPDRVFGLQGQNGIRWFFLEADRATMPVERDNLTQTSFFRKLLAYYESWRQGALKNAFRRFQVLTVTTTPERVQHLIAATHRVTHGKASGLFLFTDQRNFLSAPDLFQFPLLNGRGEIVSLYSLKIGSEHELHA